MVTPARRSFLLGGLAMLGCHPALEPRDLPGRWLRWGGRLWMVRSDLTAADPGLNRWETTRSAVRRTGAQLELRTRTDARGPWGVELWTPLQARERVSIHVQPIGELHPDDVVGLFVFRDGTCEVDIEIARWGIASGPDVHHTGPRSSSSKTLAATHTFSTHTVATTPEAVHLSSRTSMGRLETRVRPPCRPRGAESLHINLWRRDRVARAASRILLHLDDG